MLVHKLTHAELFTACSYDVLHLHSIQVQHHNYMHMHCAVDSTVHPQLCPHLIDGMVLWRHRDLVLLHEIIEVLHDRRFLLHPHHLLLDLIHEPVGEIMCNNCGLGDFCIKRNWA